MNQNDRTIQIPMLGDSTSGASLDEETTRVVWKRVRLIFVIGLVASAIVLLFNILYGVQPVGSSLGPFQRPLHFSHPLSFAIGLLIVQRGERTLARVQNAAFAVIGFNLVVVTLSIALFYPDRAAFLPEGMMLFTTAALLPSRRAQVWLAGIAVAVSILFQFFLPLTLPVLREYWGSLGTRTALLEQLWRVTGSVLIAGTSIMISRSLYRLQREARDARRFGNYVVERELGQGAMGTVYVARHALIRRPTAVKVMKRTAGDDLSRLARFEREVQLSASLTHPNTITIFDFGRTVDNAFYYAMEYLDGLDLQRVIEDFGPLPTERVVYLLDQVCGSLSEAHKLGIVHRDIKPSNIFITQRGGLRDFVKILDFGIARNVKDARDSGVTRAGMVPGTPRYMSPEQASASTLDERSDLYSLGCVMFEMLTGDAPFTGEPRVVIAGHLSRPAPRPSETHPDTPEGFDAIVKKLMEKDPADRYQKAEELRVALQEAPLPRSWNQKRAEDWWDLHAPEVAAIPGRA